MSILLIEILVPKGLTKSIKTALESTQQLVAKPKISFDVDLGISRITFQYRASDFSENGEEDYDVKKEILNLLPLSDLEDIKIKSVKSIALDDALATSSGSALDGAIRDWLEDLQANAPGFLLDIEALESSSSWPHRYSIYLPMLLFSQGTFAGLVWKKLFERIGEEQTRSLYRRIAAAMNVTHIAVNAPIQLHNDPYKHLLRRKGSQDTQIPSSSSSSENILRSPTELTPLYGDFGPLVQSSTPSPTNFDSAFWVTAIQNGITQIWAPRYTMFSRGNVSEKTRVLKLPSVAEAVKSSVESGKGCTAVDLYAGIGYFAFSYVKAGVDKLLCWELNPWSVEGMRRGAAANRWEIKSFEEGNTGSEDGALDMGEVIKTAEGQKTRLLAFQMSNERASTILAKLKGRVPPIRHVNCGLLPTSKGSWQTAVKAIDNTEGGWIHLHENMAIKDIEVQSRQILDLVQGYVNRRSQSLEDQRIPVTRLEHIERVKTYAPGVMHCVLDIYIPPLAL